MDARAIAVQGTGQAAVYAQFRAAVAQAQLTRWLRELAPPHGEREARVPGPGGTGEAGGLPRGGTGEQPPVSSGGLGGIAPPEGTLPTLIDISGPGANAAEFAAESGHSVLRVVSPGTAGLEPPERLRPSERLRLVEGDPSGLEFLANGCADGVLAEDGTLSRNLAAETLVSEISRVLRPGGRVLACVDNLTLGMAALAQQSAWPNLVDLPHADVVLVPWPDGTITRCYGAEQLRELFTAGGFDVSWIRPRTMFAPRTVSYLLARDPRSFQQLLSAELRSRPDDSVGDQLVISARKR
ncbi:MAG TPA: class I SAM-dependent methyltransferase [Trebonia sp.]